MENTTPTIAYLKRQAKNIKKEKNISHTEALNIIAKTYGYSNWIHCLRGLTQTGLPLGKSKTESFQLSFTEWLKRHKNRNSPLGDLASDAISDSAWPEYDSREHFRDYLFSKSASFDAISALERAWKSYKSYVRLKNTHSVCKPKKKSTPLKIHDARKIVFVRKAQPIPYPERTVEKFNSGDKAWISWDGKKAIPVTILEVDEQRYTFRVERPNTKAGDEHYLFLDEVRSTPEFACRNYVTL